MTEHNDYYSEDTRLASLIWTRSHITLYCKLFKVMTIVSLIIYKKTFAI